MTAFLRLSVQSTRFLFLHQPLDLIQELLFQTESWPFSSPVFPAMIHFSPKVPCRRHHFIDLGNSALRQRKSKSEFLDSCQKVKAWPWGDLGLLVIIHTSRTFNQCPANCETCTQSVPVSDELSLSWICYLCTNWKRGHGDQTTAKRVAKNRT